jgi:hypothetical protein
VLALFFFFFFVFEKEQQVLGVPNEIPTSVWMSKNVLYWMCKVNTQFRVLEIRVENGIAGLQHFSIEADQSIGRMIVAGHRLIAFPVSPFGISNFIDRMFLFDAEKKIWTVRLFDRVVLIAHFLGFCQTSPCTGYLPTTNIDYHIIYVSKGLFVVCYFNVQFNLSRSFVAVQQDGARRFNWYHDVFAT